MTAHGDTSAALDSAGMETLLQQCDVESPTVSDLRLVDAKVGRRATYEVTVDGGERRLYVKRFDDAQQAAFAAEAICTLHQTLLPPSADRVIELLGRAENTIVVAAATGSRLDTLAATTTPKTAGQWAARWLSQLHQAPAQLARTLNPDNERRTLGRWVGSIVDPPAGWATRVMERFETVGVQPPTSLVPLHKDFHHGHVFVDVDVDESVSVIDFDEARMGPADFDVAHFAVNLAALGVVTQDPWPASAAQHFVDEYRRLTGWQPGPDYDNWRSYCAVKLLWQVEQGVGPPGIAEARSGLVARPEQRASLFALAELEAIGS